MAGVNYVINRTSYSIEFGWEANDNPYNTYWRVIRSTVSSFDPYVNLTDPHSDLYSSTAYSDKGLSPDTIYWYEVQAWNGDCSLGVSFNAPISIKTNPEPLNAIPDLTASPGDYVGAVKLNWTYQNNLSVGSSYYIQYSTTANENWNPIYAQVIVSTANSKLSTANCNIGGLDVGRDGTGNIISPDYYFSIWVSTASGVFSPLSNLANSSANTPLAGTDVQTNYSDGWRTTFNGAGNGTDIGYSVAKDNFENVYITGEHSNGSNKDIIVRKYNTSGGILWTKFYNSPNNSVDVSSGIAVDGSGNVYVTGYEERSDLGQYYNILVRKYDTNGLIQWTTTYNSPSSYSDDRGSDIAVDGSGNVYVTGYEERSDQKYYYNILVRKYDTNGLIQWTTTYNSPNNYDTNGNGIAVDGSGNVYVTGYEYYLGQGSNVRKYDTNGLIQWTTTYNSPSSYSEERGSDIAVDGSGNVYVTGYEQDSNIWVRKYDTNGLIQWTTTYNSPSKGSGIAVDGSGNVYVTGYEYYLGQGSNILVRKYDTNGLIQWTTAYNSPNDSDDRGNGIAVDGSGNVYVTGCENRADLGQAYNIWLRKYQQSSLNNPVITSVDVTTNTVTFNWADTNYESSYTVKTVDSWQLAVLPANTTT